MSVSVSCQERIVPFHVILGAPIRKIAARVRENISLFHRPARPSRFPIVPGERFVLVGNGAIDVLPDLIDTVQVMPAFNQITFRVTCQTLQDFISRAREKVLVCFVGRHDLSPFLVELTSRLNLSPNGHRVIPVQVIALLRINLRSYRRVEQKDK